MRSIWLATLGVFPILSVFLTLGVLAQPVAKPRPPQLMASENGQNPSPLSLAKADIRTVITGYLAETTMTLTFQNDGDRILEGELSFPLPESATVSGYGLDVNGVLVDGVPVEKQKARVTYEKEIRKRVDPGLVEQAVGNNFTTRIYPIPAKGKRTVMVQYVADVTQEGDNAVYRLPLNWGQVVQQCTIHVEVVKSNTEPVTSGAAKLGFSQSGDRFVAEQRMRNEKLDDQLIVTLPNMAHSAVLVEKRVKAPSMDDLVAGKAAAEKADYFFTVNDHPTPPVMNREQARPSHLAIFWDASLSRATVDKTRELALLKKVLATCDSNGSVEVVPFRNEPDKAVSFPLSGGVEPIIQYLQAIVYDGGTNLSKLVFNGDPLVQIPAKQSPWRYSRVLLFTDGLANLGPEMPSRVEVPVFPISNDPRSNHALLKRIAAAGGGVYFNLERASDEQVVAGMVSAPYSLIGIECNPAEVADVYPRGSQPVLGRVTVSGRLLAEQAKLTLKYGVDGQVVKTQEFTLTRDAAAETGLICRYWAQQKVADLSSDVDGNGDALAAVGREFNLVTPNSSLLVLETVEQYLQYRIVPPKSRGDLYTQFMTRIEQQKQQTTQTHEERIVTVQNMWKQRVAWWEGTYKYANDLKYHEAAPDGAHSGHPDLGLARGGATSGGGGRPDPGTLLRLQAEQARVNAPTATPAPAAPAEGRKDQPAGEMLARPEGVPARDAAAASSAPVANQSAGVMNHVFTERTLSLGTTSDGLDRNQIMLTKAELTGAVSGGERSIAIKEWDPAVPYLVAMREAGGEGAYAVYLKQRVNFIASPAFYLDCADYLLRNGQKAMGTRVLTNIAELKLENAQLLRILAHKLNQLGDRDLAISLFEKILKSRPEEPQSCRDLALALADRADATLATRSPAQPDVQIMADYHRSLELLNQVVMTQWDRFPEIELTALMEANRIWSRVQAATLNDAISNPIDPRLIKNLDCDVRIVLTWDADATDVDLWVTEPSGEKCLYSHNRTVIGGLLSRDFTQGYGPEEYCLRHAMAGEYKIQANYYGSSQQSLIGACTVQATVITDFGRPSEKREHLTLRLTQQKDVVDVGTVKLGK